MTFLHSLLLLPNPPVGKVKVVGIDDFAWKRAKRYGTVLIDLETHDVLDLLPDREAESVKQWLLAHPEIEIVSRDRGGAYADGAAQGAPQAQQIADRWHLCKTIGDAVEDYLKRTTIQIPSSPSSDTAPPEASPVPTLPPAITPVKRTRASLAKTEQKQQRVDQVKTMHQEGNSIYTIATRLDLARNTVRRYLRLEGPVQSTPRPRKSSQLDPFYDYLCERFKDGCANASQLFEELQAKGYRGGATSVRSFVARLRKGLPGMVRPPKHANHGEAVSAVSPRELRWLLAKQEEDLTPEERQDLNRLLVSSQEVKELYGLLQSFLQMLRLRRPERLNGWMTQARESGIKELGSFVAGIERDYDAVRAGLTFPWSQGPVEGTVNKIKTHKRLMYGRASFPLLRQKLLHLT
jgi:transposase